MSLPKSYLQIQSTISKHGELSVVLAELPMPTPKEGEVLIRVEAAPINPSDQAVMFGGADLAKAKTFGSQNQTELKVPVSPKSMETVKARFGQALPIGNEGAGTVVATGLSPQAQALSGKVVAALGGGMFGQYRCVPASMCLALLPEHTAKDGASSFVNPLTALSMVEVMRREGHTALVHTAAASNLGQMLNLICIADGVELVNIVRSEEQAATLRKLGAKHICDSSKETFLEDLTDAVHVTGASLAFDAIGGGELASNILRAMEAAANRTPSPYSIYGSLKFKQVYTYGSLNTSPIMLDQGYYGKKWSLGGWLVTHFLNEIGPDENSRLRRRVANELNTTFLSRYTDEISLSELLQADTVARYGPRKTGEKFLLCPQKAL